MKLAAPVVLLFSALGPALQVTPARAQSASDLDFFFGRWEVTVTSYGPNGGTSVSQATTHAYPILDGAAQQDDWRSLDRSGNVVFRGSSIRSWVPATRSWVVHWIMAGTPGYTYIDAEWRNGELHGTGRGFDGGGEFVERYRYYDVSNERYSFELERSYDGGANWRLMARSEASKVADAED